MKPFFLGGVIEQVYLGLSDSDGSVFDAQPILTMVSTALSSSQIGEGQYTNADGKVYIEPCIAITDTLLGNVIAFLEATRQESALVQDSRGDHYLLGVDGSYTYKGKMVLLAERPDSGDWYKFGKYYFQLTVV